MNALPHQAPHQRRSPRQNEARAQWLYLISREGCFVKIGVSKSPKRRLTQLQVSTPKRLRLEGQWRFGATVAAEVEGYLKTEFAPLKASGEWFEVEADAMAATIATLHPDSTSRALIPIAVAYAIADRDERRLEDRLRAADAEQRKSLMGESEALHRTNQPMRLAAWAAGFVPNKWDVTCA